VDQICFALPILPGKTEDARAFQRELDTAVASPSSRSHAAPCAAAVSSLLAHSATLPAGMSTCRVREGTSNA
jgi:hypothetical protein